MSDSACTTVTIMRAHPRPSQSPNERITTIRPRIIEPIDDAKIPLEPPNATFTSGLSASKIDRMPAMMSMTPEMNASIETIVIPTGRANASAMMRSPFANAPPQRDDHGPMLARRRMPRPEARGIRRRVTGAGGPPLSRSSAGCARTGTGARRCRTADTSGAALVRAERARRDPGEHRCEGGEQAEVHPDDRPVGIRLQGFASSDDRPFERVEGRDVRHPWRREARVHEGGAQEHQRDRDELRDADEHVLVAGEQCRLIRER